MGRVGTSGWTRGATASVLAAMAALLLAPAAGAATITVATTADSSASKCTLRDAITAANSDSAKGGCKAGHGADTIRSTAQGTVQLQSALPIIASPMTLALPGPSKFEVIRDAGANFGIFDVRTLDAVTISGVKVANGRLDEYFAEGAGINHTEGDLTLRNVDVDGNVVTDTESTKNPQALGAGIFNASDATLTIADSTVENNTAMAQASGDNLALADGGGLFNVGTLTVEESTFDSNAATATGENYGAAGGGGIENDASAFINTSTISHNTATASATDPSATSGNALTFGAGIYEQNMFGASNLQLNMSLDTVASNTASATGSNTGQGVNRGAGVTVFNGSSNIARSTIADNSGITGDVTSGDNFDLNSPSGTSIFWNTIVAGGSLAAGNCTRENGTIDSYDNNLEDDAAPESECNFTDQFDISGQDPDLQPLQDNGGPTKTMALAPGSPAIDAGDTLVTAGEPAADVVKDQRGYTGRRDLDSVTDPPGSDGSDIGAFEVQTTITTPVALDFGRTAVGSQSSAKQLTLENPTGSTVQVGTVVVGSTPETSDSPTNQYRKTSDNCSGRQLAPNATCTVSITFAPTVLRPTVDPFVSFPGAGASPWFVTLTGTPFDATAPKVKLKPMKVNDKKHRAKATFSAKDDVSPEPDLSFKCSLDGKRARRCSSPKTYKHLKPGKHTFAVTARDAAGNTSKAAKAKFKIPQG